MKMIQVNLDDTEIDNTISTPFLWKMEYNLRENLREAKRK